MVYKVVATKLTEDEHTKLLDACNKEGCTPSNFIKESIMKRLSPEEKPPEKKITTLEELLKGLKKESESKELSTKELREHLGLTKD